ncbi:MFS transporter [Nonomuraea sp. NPDC049152]|uniref:MFS transporter n=1 Tax=Nonomuraea sp. NPDC049152 TaxID=3154350 RepID=UPI0033F72F29
MEAKTAQKGNSLALLVVMLATFMDMVDVTIVHIALPKIQQDLGAGYSTGQWVVAGYSLAYALMLVTGGRLGDIAGRRRVFVIGVAGFTLASALAGAASSAEVLVIARIVQGAFGGIMVPQVMSTITTQFPPGKERMKAFGLFGAVIGIAQVSGPLLGGVLSDYSLFGLGWRAIFFINLPIGLFALVGAFLWIRESRSDQVMRLDLVGVVLVSAASALLLYPLIQGHDLGWPTWTLVSMAAAVPVLVVFALYERRTAFPLVPPRLFTRRSFVAGTILLFVLFSGVASFFLVLTWDLQFGLGWSPIHLALTTLGWPFGIGFTGQLANRYGQRYGRRLIGIGAAVMAVGLAAMSVVLDLAGTEVTSWQILPCLFVSGLGMGMCVGIAVNVVLGDVPLNDAGAGSGVLNSLIQIGGAVGVALVGVIFFGMTDGTRDPAAFSDAAATTLWYNVAVFALAALLSPFLPRGAVQAEEQAPVLQPVNDPV